MYAEYQTDEAGEPLDGGEDYVLRFAPGQLPPVDFYWSLTLYNVPQRLLVENPIDRYALNSKNEGLKYGSDGSLEIYVQHDNPGGERESNWLPAPEGAYFLNLRMYGPKPELLNGDYKVPPLVPAE
jgi:hypothetical protein